MTPPRRLGAVWGDPTTVLCRRRLQCDFNRRLARHCFGKLCAMGTLSSPHKRKLRVLCLHGFRTNASIMKTQLAKWDRSVLDLLDLVCLDAPYPATGESDVEGFFPPPFYEWFQYEKTETGALNYKTLKECIQSGEVTYKNLKECMQFITDFMETQGPFDGLIGFSQGSILSAALAGMQQQGLVLTSIPALRFLIIISGGVLKGEHELKGCYPEVIRCPSVHLIGDNDPLKSRSELLLPKFEDPVVVRHGAKHTVPRLGGTKPRESEHFPALLMEAWEDMAALRQHLAEQLEREQNMAGIASGTCLK